MLETPSIFCTSLALSTRRKDRFFVSFSEKTDKFFFILATHYRTFEKHVSMISVEIEKEQL